jgi:hypothetical protein
VCVSATQHSVPLHTQKSKCSSPCMQRTAYCRDLRVGRATHGQVLVVRQGSALEGRVAPYPVEVSKRFPGTVSGFCKTSQGVFHLVTTPTAALFCAILTAHRLVRHTGRCIGESVLAF